MFLIVGPVLTVAITGGIMGELRRERALLAGGDSAVATVVSKQAYTRGDDARVYEIGYEFPLSDGRTWAATRQIHRDGWNRLGASDRLAVRYDRRNPDRHLLPDFATPPALRLMGLFPLVFIVVGALILRRGLGEVLLPLRLFRTGQATRGRVTGFQTIAGETMNGRHPVRVRYAFRDGTSGEHEGSIKTLDGELLDALEEGTEVTVLYDRRKPAQNTLLAALGSGKVTRPGNSTVA
jgi:hypothetical protein